MKKKESIIVLIISTVGIIATNFISLQNPKSLVLLSIVPLLYGYIIRISHEEFNQNSLAALPTMIFILVGGITAIASLAYSLGPILVSYFSGGDKFKDFYGATSIPLLVLGLTIGTGLFFYGSVNEEFKTNKISSFSQGVGDFASKTVQDMGMVEKQKQSQLLLVNSTSKVSTRIMARRVINNSNPSPDVQNELIEAQREVPAEVYVRTRKKLNNSNMDLSKRVEENLESLLNGKRFYLIIPITTGFIYSLQPIMGLLTALSAFLIRNRQL